MAFEENEGTTLCCMVSFTLTLTTVVVEMGPAWLGILTVDYTRGFPTNDINSVAIILAVWRRVPSLVRTPLQPLIL